VLYSPEPSFLAIKRIGLRGGGTRDKQRNKTVESFITIKECDLNKYELN
jgi:hypothetical protein